VLYILSGLGGSVASLWWGPDTLSVGASGAVFGVAGGLVAFLFLTGFTGWGLAYSGPFGFS
jgi:rhomboid protease GluP